MKYFLILLILISGAVFVFISPIKFLLNFSNDDSFFYIKTAYNFSKGFGSTFDLVNETNGYHPLWFIFLSIFFFLLNLVTTFSPELYFRFVILLDFIICISILYILYNIWETNNFGNSVKHLIIFIPLFLLLVFTRDYGLETHLICLIVALYLLVKSIELNSNKNLRKYKFVLLILLFLVRIDFLFNVIPIIIISDCFTMPKEQRKKFFLYSSSSVIIISLFYFLSNYFFFNNLLIISGTIKNSFPHFVFLKNVYALTGPGYLTNQFIKSFFLAAIIIIFIFIISNKKFKDKFFMIDFFLFGICCAALSFILFNLSFNKHSLKEWYVAFPSFVGSLLFIRMLFIFPKYYYINLFIFIVAFLIYFYLARIKNSKWDNVYDYAIELKKNTNDEDRIFQIDLCGIVGYFSERKVINGDGIINSFEYQDYLKAKNLKKYFEDKKINYYSTHSSENSYYQIKDSSNFYIDSHYSNNLGGYSFTFPAKNLVFQMPFIYNHIINKEKGSWYLFKIPE